jgi:L-lactate dehydrogenase (cytochrome)
VPVRTASFINVRQARQAARRILPPVVFDYIDGGADDETTLRANETAFADIMFRPRMPAELATPVLATNVLGQAVSMPVLLAPCGLVRVIHPDSGSGAARAAASRQTVSLLSTGAGAPVEQVAAAAPGSVWFQLYAWNGHQDADRLIGRAADAGVQVLVVTVDTAAVGNRERDRRHGVVPPLRLTPRNVARFGPQVLGAPVWAGRMTQETVRTIRRAGVRRVLTHDIFTMSTSPFSWPDIEWIRARWPGRIVVKGLMAAEDAVTAVSTGADAVVVSNHGGRQLDGAMATIQVLPEIAEAVGGTADVLLDGGIRRGTDVLKAVALGAKAVLIGRPYLWGLAVAGQQGVERILDVLREEMLRSMTLLGCPSVTALDQKWVRLPPAARSAPGAMDGSSSLGGTTQSQPDGQGPVTLQHRC